MGEISEINNIDDDNINKINAHSGENVSKYMGHTYEGGAPAAGVWVAVGDSGHIATSATLNSGSAWTTYEAPVGATANKRSVAYGVDPNGTNVWFVGHDFDYTNELMSASAPADGASAWTEVDPGDIGGVYGIAYSSYGGKSWIGVGFHGEIVRLSSGSWSIQDIGTDGILSVATDANGTWVVNTSTSNRNWAIYKSVDDGATWTSSRSSWIGAGVQYSRKHVAYGNGVWVVTFENQIWTASDSDLTSNTWTQRHSGGDHFNDVQYGTSGKWMAIGHNRQTKYSSDNGTNWEAATNIVGSDEPTGLAYHNGSWVVVTDGTVDNIIVSTNDGTSWGEIASTGGSLNEIAVNSALPNV